MAKEAKEVRQVITANRLLDGAVVYYTADRTWALNLTDAQSFSSEAAATAAVAQITSAGARAPVIDVAAIELALEADHAPTRLRERIRAVGPTVRADLGRA